MPKASVNEFRQDLIPGLTLIDAMIVSAVLTGQRHDCPAKAALVVRTTR